MKATEFADLIDVTEGAVSRLLSGNRKPSTELQVRIKQVLGWSVDEQAELLVNDRQRYAEELTRRVGLAS